MPKLKGLTMSARKFSDAEAIDELLTYAEACDCEVDELSDMVESGEYDVESVLYSLTATIDGLVSRSDRTECGVYEVMIDCGAWEK